MGKLVKFCRFCTKKKPSHLLMAGALSYETVLRNLVSLCSSRPANASDAFDAGELFIKQLEALERAFRLSGTHQNTSFNPGMIAEED